MVIVNPLNGASGIEIISVIFIIYVGVISVVVTRMNGIVHVDVFQLFALSLA